MAKIITKKQFIVRCFYIVLITTITLTLRIDTLDRPINDRHSFRQTITYSVIQNYFRTERNILFPRLFQILPENNTERLFLAEFPFYEYIVSSIFKITGERLYIARLFSVVLTAATSIAVFLIGQRHKNSITGFLSALSLNFFPASIFWGSSISPEIFAIACATWAVFLSSSKNKYLFFLSAMFLGVSISIKPYFITYLVPIIYFWQNRKLKLKTSIAYITLTILPVVLWYLRRLTVPSDVRYPGSILFHLSGSDSLIRFWQSNNYWSFILTERVFGEVLTPLGGLLLLYFLTTFFRSKTKYNLFLGVWIISVFFAIGAIAWGNFHHDYYQLIMLPPAALAVGLIGSDFCTWITNLIKNRQHITVFISVFFVYFLGYFLWFVPLQTILNNYFIAEVNYSLFSSDIESTKETIPKNSKIVILDYAANDLNPTLLNHIERNGWLATLENVCSPEEVIMAISRYSVMGAKILVFQNQTYILNNIDCDRGEILSLIEDKYTLLYKGKYLTLFEI